MAAAFYNHFVGSGAVSAGTQPGERVHPEVVAVMQEEGIDLSGVKPQLLTDSMARDTDLLITMGCGEACPLVSGLKRDDWPLADPKGKPLDEVRQIRDEVKHKVLDLIRASAQTR
jgi:arsenate reductase